MQAKLTYLEPQVQVISLGAKESFCQTSGEVEMLLATDGLMFEDLEIQDLTF